MASDHSSLLCGATIPVTNEKINEVFRFHMDEIDREKPAVITGTDILTYGDLDYKSDVIAAHLFTLNNKTTKQPIIGIFMNLSEESIISILAIFKSGACYIPIDPCYSEDQILHAIHKIDISCILTCSCYIEKLKSCIDPKIDIYEIHSILESRNSSTIQNLSKEENHEQLACIMFTSGSTAEPKRVKLSHQNLFNVIKWHWRVLPLDPNEKVLAMKSLCCIDSIIEVFPALLKGISVVVVPRNVKSNDCFLLQYLKDHEITRTITSPRLLRSMLSYLDTNSSISANLKVKLWISTGEALTKATLSRFFTYFPSSKIVNCYGCTEVTGNATAIIIDEASFMMINDGVLIGEPVDNSDIYIVKDKGELAQVGKKGEIWISGHNVAIGYYEHTSDQFLQNIFEDRKSKYKVLYKTGDYGYIKDGFLYYTGRLESQIKIDGMTIETIEIENALQSICLINDAVVLHQNSAENFPILLAFCVYNDGNTCSEEIAAKLRSVLPSQFIPTIVKVEDFPVLPSGKIDKLSLWKQYQDKGSDKKENEVLSIIKNVIGVDIDNELMSKTLYELGGSSLAIIEILIGLENAGYRVDPIMLNVCTVEVLGTLQKGIDLFSEINSLDDKFRIQEVSEDVDLKVVSSIIGKSFTTKNYLDVAAKINVEDHFCLMKEMWPNLVKEKCSFVVWNQKDEMVGVMVNTDFFHEPEIKIPERLLPILLMHEELENHCREKLQESGKRLLHNVLLATSASLTAAENVLLVVFMEHKLLEHAKQHGFHGVFTINSSQITQAVCTHILNYQEIDDLDVHEYVYNGEKLFADVPAAIKLIASYKLI